MNSRIVTLLEKFELKNRSITDKIYNEQLEEDYSNAYLILEKEQQKVLNYLQKVLR